MEPRAELARENDRAAALLERRRLESRRDQSIASAIRQLDIAFADLARLCNSRCMPFGLVVVGRERELEAAAKFLEASSALPPLSPTRMREQT
jgi:hypothetical protein